MWGQLGLACASRPHGSHRHKLFAAMRDNGAWDDGEKSRV